MEEDADLDSEELDEDGDLYGDSDEGDALAAMYDWGSGCVYDDYSEDSLP
jgi:hypothetical protein